MLAIIASVFYFDKTKPFPSVYALIPVLGTVLLVLFAEKETIVAKLLSIKAVVGIGLISYSAYLWHQPILAFIKYKAPTNSIHTLSSFAVVASLVLAYLTWLFIERPFRDKSKFSSKQIGVLSLSGILFFALFGYFASINTFGSLALFRADAYRGDHVRDFLKDPNQHEISNGQNVYIWGDSFALVLTDPLSKTLKNTILE